MISINGSNIGRSISLWALTVLLSACSSQLPSDPSMSEDVLTLSASQIQVTTQTRSQFTAFDEGVKYSISATYAGSDDWNNALWSPNPRVCMEKKRGNAGYIDYYSNYGGQLVSLGMKSVDFYGLTYDSPTKEIQTVDYDTKDPSKIKVSPDKVTGEIGDLMFSNNLKDCNSSQGVLQMNFKHATSRIKFEIYKQDETGYEERLRYFQHVTLKKIEIFTSKEAKFSVVKGDWSNQSVLEYVPFYTTEQKNGDPIQVSVQDVPGSMLIIPNADDTPLKVKVTLGKVGDGISDRLTDRVVEHILYSDLGGNVLRFLPNHQYTLSIGVMREKDKIVIAFDPIVEPWKDIDIDLGEI